MKKRGEVEGEDLVTDLTCTNYSLPRILLRTWFCLFLAIFQQVSDFVISTGFLSTNEYSSKSLHLPIRQPVSTISSNYTSHHELSIIQASNYSKYHTCLQILVCAPSATALLQHGIPFLPPSKIVRSYIVFKCHLKSYLIAQLINKAHSVWPPGDLPAPPIHA